MWKLQSEYLRKKRLASGKKQVEIGRALGHSAQHIANLERNAAGIPPGIARDVVDLIGGDLEKLSRLAAEDFRQNWLREAREARVTRRNPGNLKRKRKEVTPVQAMRPPAVRATLAEERRRPWMYENAGI